MRVLDVENEVHFVYLPVLVGQVAHVPNSASKSSIRRSVITEKAPTRAFSWLKAATTTFTFKTLLRHYAKRALTPWSLNVKLGPRRNYHKGRAAIRHYANQTPLSSSRSLLRDYEPSDGPV